jgi:phosphate transport system protein
MLEGHTSKAFDGAMVALHMRVTEMGGLALHQAREAVTAYTAWDLSAAERVLERERQLNAYDTTIDAEQLALIARRQPVASDLRMIVSISKAVSELERVGDEAKKIVRTVGSEGVRPGPATCRDVENLARLAIALLRQALQAFDRLETPLAEQVIAGDRQIDDEYAAGLRRLLTRAVGDPRGFQVALEAAFVLKSLERIGDHARNLARYVLAIGSAAPREEQLQSQPAASA